MILLKQIHGVQVPEESEEPNQKPHQILVTLTFHKHERNKNRMKVTTGAERFHSESHHPIENDSLAVRGTRTQPVPHCYGDGGLSDGRHVPIEPPRLLAEPRKKRNPGRPAVGRLIIAACRLLLAR